MSTNRKLHASFSEKEAEDLQRKFRAAIQYAKGVCAFGSSNKIKDLEKTHAWNCFMWERCDQPTGRYLKFSEGKFDDTIDKDANYRLSPETGERIYSYQHSVSLLHLKNESEITDEILQNAKKEDRPVLIRIENNYSLYSDPEGKGVWRITPIDALFSKLFFKLPFENKIIHRHHPLFFPILGDLIKKYHIDRINRWYFHPQPIDQNNPKQTFTVIAPLSTYEHPLLDPRFKRHSSHMGFFLRTLLLTGKRAGNCSDLARLVSKYLWEHPKGIHNIKIIGMGSIDHAFVGVNINPSADLKKPETWGEDAWIIDPWYKDGIIYRAKDFKMKIKRIKQFGNSQDRKLRKMGFTTQTHQNLGDDIDKCVMEIIPQETPYPTYQGGKNVEDYFVLKNMYPATKNPDDNIIPILAKIKRQHQAKFNRCLADIKTLGENTHLFFQNRKKNTISIDESFENTLNQNKRQRIK